MILDIKCLKLDEKEAFKKFFQELIDADKNGKVKWKYNFSKENGSYCIRTKFKGVYFYFNENGLDLRYKAGFLGMQTVGLSALFFHYPEAQKQLMVIKDRLLVSKKTFYEEFISILKGEK